MCPKMRQLLMNERKGDNSLSKAIKENQQKQEFERSQNEEKKIVPKDTARVPRYC